MSAPHAQPDAHAPGSPTGHDEAHGHEGHISDKTFMKIFGILLVCTMISFGANQLIGHHAVVANFIIILGVAVLKASLVVMFFMHLKIDWREGVGFIMPTLILAAVVLLVLWPPLVL